MNFILDILFPKKCIGCSKEGSYICGDCVLNILQTDLICPQCSNLSIGGLTHPSCEMEFALDGLWSLGVYRGFLRKAIQRLKYEPSLVRGFAPVLAGLIVDYWTAYEPYIYEEIQKSKNWIVVPVPLHWYRENKRGFNQSALLGKLLSNSLGLSYCEGLKRIRYTRPQVKLKRGERKENIKNAFSVSSSFQPLTSNILLIDDVWTTGSTLKQCCKVLKTAGAKQVWALTLAR